MENCSMKEVFGEVISRYTRAQAIEDGVLIDVTATTKEVGIKYPVALTAGVYDAYVRVPKALKGMQDEAGRLFDVVWMLAWAIRTGEVQREQELFTVSFLMYNDNARTRNDTITLKSVCGPGDDSSPCITVAYSGINRPGKPG